MGPLVLAQPDVGQYPPKLPPQPLVNAPAFPLRSQSFPITERAPTLPEHTIAGAPHPGGRCHVANYLCRTMRAKLAKDSAHASGCAHNVVRWGRRPLQPAWSQACERRLPMALNPTRRAFRRAQCQASSMGHVATKRPLHGYGCRRLPTQTVFHVSMLAPSTNTHAANPMP